MKFFRKNWAFITIIFMLLAYTLLMSYFCIQRNRAFGSGYDLANIADTVWQTSQGNFFKLTGDTGLISRFSVHSDLILILLAPFYLLFPTPNLLLIVQAFAVGFSIIPIFLISRKILKNDVLGIIISFVFLISPNVLWANIYDFHPVLLAFPLLFFAFYFLLIKKWFPFWLFIVLSLFTKENVGLFIAMMGFLAFFKYREKKVGLVLFTLGMGFSILAIKFIMPAFNSGQQHWALAWYDFSSGIIPRIWHEMTNLVALKYYLALLAPYAFLPLLALPWLLPALPDLFINLTSQHIEMQSLIFHYQSLIVIAMTIALIMAFSHIKTHRRLLILSVFFLLFISLRQNYLYSPFSNSPGQWHLSYLFGGNEINFEKALEKIPQNAIVASSSEVRPHVINHRLSYNLPSGVSQADYIALVSQNRFVGDDEAKPYETQLISNLKNNSHYQILYENAPFYLFKKIN
jgi:uncharacterized membrane protein